MTHKEIERKMVELARKYLMTHNLEIAAVIYRLGRELDKTENVEKQ